MPKLLDLLVPPRCALCGAPGPVACPACLAGVPLLGPVRCARCGRPTDHPVRDCRECRGRRLGFSTAAAAAPYEAGARELVHHLKGGGVAALAAPAAALVALALEPPAGSAITWVPPDPWREAVRGYHPPRLLAEQLGARWRLPARPLLAARARRSQRGLDRGARRANVRGLFSPAAAVPRRVVLVDDVFTTGATLSACATALRRGGAREVHAITFARAVSRL
jgi:predicted amidophosphoribosyltransferase